MVVWFYYLPGTGVTGEKRFYGGSGLIVGDVEDWFVPSFGEVVEDRAESSDNVVTCSGLNREGVDVVGVIRICDEEVLISVCRSGGQSPRGVCVDRAFGLIR